MSEGGNWTKMRVKHGKRKNQIPIHLTDEYFRTLEVSTLVGCPVLCEFCPQNLYISRYPSSTRKSERSMNPSSFQKIIDNLQGSVVSKVLFSGYAENFCNPDTPELIIMAHNSCFDVSVITTGVGLTQETIDRLTDIPFKRFAFSLQPVDSKMRKGIADQESIWQCLEYAIPRLSNVQIDVLCRAENRKTDGILSLERYVKKLGLPFRTDWHDRAGNLNALPERDNGPMLAPTYCSRPLTNVVQPNGDVALCCMDWGLDHVIGNLLQRNYRYIIEGAAMKRILSQLETVSLDHVLCRHCHYLEEVTEDWVPITVRRYNQYNSKLTDERVR